MTIHAHAGHPLSILETRHTMSPVKELTLRSDSPQVDVVAVDDPDPHIEDVHIWCAACSERIEIDEAVNITWVESTTGTWRVTSPDESVPPEVLEDEYRLRHDDPTMGDDSWRQGGSS